MSTIHRLYTNEFKDVKKSDRIALIISLVSLTLGLIALYIPLKPSDSISKERVNECNEIAINFERVRHTSDDLEITNQDISSYMKNMVACLSD